MSSLASARSRFGILKRHYGEDHPKTLSAKEALDDERLMTAVQRALAAAPPLTDEVRQRILGMLMGAS
ncbi:hypothetical protein [Mycobacterium sp. URHB0021]